MEGPVRPWGSYEVLAETPAFKVKSITVLAGQRLSYQRHFKRSEHWLVVEGRGIVTLDGAVTKVGPGSAVDVPVAASHRIENNGSGPLTFIEIQRGDYLGEDDIERLADDYGRMQSDLASGDTSGVLEAST